MGDLTQQALSVRFAIQLNCATDRIDAAAGAHDNASLEELHRAIRQYPLWEWDRRHLAASCWEGTFAEPETARQRALFDRHPECDTASDTAGERGVTFERMEALRLSGQTAPARQVHARSRRLKTHDPQDRESGSRGPRRDTGHTTHTLEARGAIGELHRSDSGSSHREASLEELREATGGG